RRRSRGVFPVPIARRVPGSGQEGGRGALGRKRPVGAGGVPRIHRPAGAGAGTAGIGAVSRQTPVAPAAEGGSGAMRLLAVSAKAETALKAALSIFRR